MSQRASNLTDRAGAPTDLDGNSPRGRLGAWLHRVTSELSATMAVVLSVLPCGMLALAMATAPTARDHARRPSACERASWRVLLSRRPMRVADKLWLIEGMNKSASASTNLPEGVAVAAPLSSPLLRGYPGAVLVAREPGSGPLADAEIARLMELTRELPTPPSAGLPVPGADNAVTILSADSGRLLFPHKPELVDPRLLQQMAALVREEPHHGMTRWMARTSAGVMLPFRVTWNNECPGLSDGPVAWFCRAPLPADWAALSAADLSGEPEIARLLPAVQFMLREFPRRPSLSAIARCVHLSPFHFHRRFSDCMGITPKHFLLDCQIAAAQQDLLGAEKTLAQIAADCGFSHQSHFTSRFKQATGLTPVQWRKLAVQNA